MSDEGSWWFKLARADQHLKDFNRLVSEYVATNPYAMTKALEGKSKRNRGRWVHRIDITQPADELLLACVVGDFLFNVRSALDHIVVASVRPRKHRRHASFPIFTDNIWERGESGKYKARYQEGRDNWNRWTAGLSDEALAIVEEAQPYNGTQPDPHGIGVKNHVLAILSALQNADKHRELIVTGGFLELEHVVAVEADGSMSEILSDGPPASGQPLHMLENHAELNVAKIIPDPGSVDVKVYGTVEVLIGRGTDGGPMYRPPTLTDIIAFARRRIEALDALLT